MAAASKRTSMPGSVHCQLGIAPGRTMKRYVVILSTLLLSLFASCSVFRMFEERDDFIKVRGTQFLHKGKPYYFVGANLWYGCYLGSSGESGDRPRLLRELDSLKALGIENLRILGSSENSYMRRAVKPAIQSSPGVVDDTLLQGLDFLLAELANRHMRAVIYLNNYWEWSGGMTQYNVWTGKDPVDPEDTTKGWGAFMEFSASFYANRQANELFRNYVYKVVTRKNSVNDRSYREDPTIMAWQLANEPRPGKLGPVAEENLPAYFRWIDQTAFYIHSLDTNHLVSSGSEGTTGSLLSADNFLQAHQSRHIDYLTMHMWPFNWGWFDPQRIEKTFPTTESNSMDYISSHLALARTLNKPIVMEEFGLGRDGGKILPGTPTTARDRFYSLVLQTVYDSARGGGPIAGTNFWAWGGEAIGRNPDGYWKRGDPFVGDPPQEPQGMNSVFATDISTVRIIRQHAMLMKRLGNVDTLLTSAK